MSPALNRTAQENSQERPRWEVADIFHLYGERYRQSHPLPSLHRKVMHAIEVCRTAALGGHLERCESCGYERPAYNSCRNRHCPKCQALTKARWLQARQAELLPTGYFHNVFTLPHELNPLALSNKTLIYNLLFASVSETLREFGADPRHGLDGKLGFIAVLHTWDQKLLYHVHLHCVIAGGALSHDGRQWKRSHPKFLFPVKALSRLFRGKFLAGLKKAYRSGQLVFPGVAATFAGTRAFNRLLSQLWKKEWVVYSKRPFAGPRQVLDYLGRYTHRVAISNHRIRKLQDGCVTFSYRDRQDQNRSKELKLAAEEFIRRFLLHVLPSSHVRIRHFGFLANRHKKENLARCRKLFGLPGEVPKPLSLSVSDLMLQLTGQDVTKCPNCGTGTLLSFPLSEQTSLLGSSVSNCTPVFDSS
ncbi:IS91 family transposase [Acidobacteria bacterium AH-259-D05]|nr:IS91 family transposase [Acidobacteria bacterium AH-259-D05]